MGKVEPGCFIKITERKVSDKIQPWVKSGSNYKVLDVGKLKNGSTVLTIEVNHGNENKSRCNEDRFSWRLITEEEVDKERMERLCRMEIGIINKKFTLDDHIKITFVPYVIANTAWKFTNEVLKFTAEHRMSEFKKMSRAIKTIRDEYDRYVSREIGPDSYRMLMQQSDEFIKSVNKDIILLYHAVWNSFQYNFKGAIYVDLMTLAYLAVLFIDACYKYESEMTAMMRSRLGNVKGSHVPFIDSLRVCLASYYEGCIIDRSRGIDTGLKVYMNKVRSYRFDISTNK